MDRTAKGCGQLLVGIGVIVSGFGLVRMLAGFQAPDAEWLLSAGLITISVGVGIVIWGIFFLSIGEIIARLPEPAHGKTCAECAELIKLQARRCRYCGHDFPPVEAQALNPARTDESDSKLAPCPNCRRQIPRTLTRCTFCRTELL